ncbi:MAG: T9SS type A sorting domain-containing protein [Bacteroidia bacterium]|nr:T9SS type A sorting domain-containing protein [Bacteroidia bacterium]
MWTCISGGSGSSQKSVYGVTGLASPTNKLGSRRGAVSWTDVSGNFWLFGGLGFDSNHTYRSLNELWRYNTFTNQWTFMGGNNTSQPNGNYGSIGVPANSNMPGGRSDCAWSSDINGNLLLFGGSGYDASSSSQLNLNDLWRYNISTNQWTWIKGSSMSSQTGVYGTQGISSPSNTPGSRSGSAFWTDASGKFYIFGGHGFSSVPGNSLNDLWKYDNVTNEWTWLKGSNFNSQSGNYGVLGIPSISNMPGSRSLPAQWYDNSGNLWLFGGSTSTVNATAIYSDLWKFNFCTGTAPVLSVSATSTTICTGQQVTLFASGASFYSWNGMQSGTTASISLTPSATVNYAVSGMNTNGCVATTNISVNLSTCVGIKSTDINATQLELYPNPTSGLLNIKTGSELEGSVKIYNTSGQLLFHSLINSDQHTLDLTNYTTGIYLLEIMQGGTVSRKLIQKSAN